MDINGLIVEVETGEGDSIVWYGTITEFVSKLFPNVVEARIKLFSVAGEYSPEQKKQIEKMSEEYFSEYLKKADIDGVLEFSAIHPIIVEFDDHSIELSSDKIGTLTILATDIIRGY